MVSLRAKKIASIANDYPALQVEGDTTARTLLIGFGSTYGSLRTAIEGLPIALIHLRHVNPLPNDLGHLLSAFDNIFVAELNSGQLCQLIRANYLVDAKSISQCSGQPFSTSFIVNAIKSATHMEVCHG